MPTNRPRVSPAPEHLLQECYRRSMALLKKNSLPLGIIASARSRKAVDRNYASIFGRDAAICALGMVASQERELVRAAKQSLMTLATHQAPNGQIPKYVDPEQKKADFWYSGCIDATLWWLIAVDFYHERVPRDRLRTHLHRQVERALQWLFCQEHQGMFLLQQNEASDWADIMPRSGFVLTSNALWYHVKKRYAVPKAQRTKHFFKHIFFPFDKSCPDHRRARILSHYVRNRAAQRDFYLSFVNFSFWGEEIDVLGNVLACLFGLAYPSKSERIVDSLRKLRVQHPYPLRVVHDPIRKESRLWRPYMERYRQNLPYQYHNGGIWPFAAGFWIMLLEKLKKRDLARHELLRFAEANSIGQWDFNEWFHGKTGRPMGMRHQSWNAAMFILAYHAVNSGIRMA